MSKPAAVRLQLKRQHHTKVAPYAIALQSNGRAREESPTQTSAVRSSAVQCSTVKRHYLKNDNGYIKTESSVQCSAVQCSAVFSAGVSCATSNRWRGELPMLMFLRRLNSGTVKGYESRRRRGRHRRPIEGRLRFDFDDGPWRERGKTLTWQSGKLLQRPQRS